MEQRPWKQKISWSGQETEKCLVETERLAHMETEIEKIIAFRWNRRYPADFRLDLCLAGWTREEVREFPGTSHEKITEETYVRII